MRPPSTEANEPALGEAAADRERRSVVVLLGVDNRCSTAQNPLVAKAVGESNARAEVVVVEVVRVNALAVAAREREIAATVADRIDGIHVERVLLVVDALVARRIQIPTKPEIDREPGADAPVVLREDAHGRGQRPDRRRLVN